MSYIQQLLDGDLPQSLGSLVVLILAAGFTLWMLIDAVRRGEYVWAVLMLIFSLITVLLYFFMVYRPATASSGTRGFELPGAGQRQRVRELKAQIHHLDKAHHWLQLGDVYFTQGKLQLAEQAYRSSLERDDSDRDARAHLGQCLLRQGRAAEARTLLEAVVAEESKHDYGHTQMALAEALVALGQKSEAGEVWRRVNEQHSYPRARVQWAELLIEEGKKKEAAGLLNEVLMEDPHAPAFQRKRDKVWVRRAKSLMRRC